mgnify:CR=1 FL=1
MEQERLRERLEADLALIKLQVEGCRACGVSVGSKLLTETVEVWDCTGCKVRLASKASTVQVDKCTGLALTYAAVGHFDRIMHTGPRQLARRLSGVVGELPLPKPGEALGPIPNRSRCCHSRCGPRPPPTFSSAPTSSHPVLERQLRESDLILMTDRHSDF